MSFQIKFEDEDQRLVDELRSANKKLNGTIPTRKGMVRQALKKMKEAEDLVDEVRFMYKKDGRVPTKIEILNYALRVIKNQAYQMNGAETKREEF